MNKHVIVMNDEEPSNGPYFFAFAQIPFWFKREGVHIKSITGEQAQLQLVQLDPMFSSDHAHDNEQIGIVLAGQIELTIDQDTRTCQKGDAYYIPPNVQHGFQVLGDEQAELLEVFAPPKEENRMRVP